MFSIEHLHTLRTAEIDKIVAFFRPGARVLEIGAGTGHQALDLFRRGIDITAIEIPSSNYAQARVFSVTEYDGRQIPFDDASFDIVFSSNVMEHVPDLHQTNREIQRILRPSGYCVHVMPTHVWRFWTTLSAFPAAFQHASVLKSKLLTIGIPRTQQNQETARPPPRSTILPTSPRRTRQHHFRALVVSSKLVAARISRRRV